MYRLLIKSGEKSTTPSLECPRYTQPQHVVVVVTVAVAGTEPIEP